MKIGQKMSKLWEKVIKKKNSLKSEKYRKIHCNSVFAFFTFFVANSFFWPIFMCNTAMESYRHVDHTCFIHLKKSQKMKALEQKKFY